MKSKHSFTLSQLAELCGVELSGDGSEQISGIGTIDGAKQGEITFLANSLYRDSLKNTEASAVILSAEDQSFSPTHCLVSPNPYATYARIAQLLFPFDEQLPSVHPSAVIADNVVLPQSVTIGAHVVIESGAAGADGAGGAGQPSVDEEAPESQLRAAAARALGVGHGYHGETAVRTSGRRPGGL